MHSSAHLENKFLGLPEATECYAEHRDCESNSHRGQNDRFYILRHSWRSFKTSKSWLAGRELFGDICAKCVQKDFLRWI